MLDKILERIRNKEFEVDASLYPRSEKSFSDMKLRQALRTAEADKQKEFRKALADTYELTDHPKEELLFNLAWEQGHSSGYNEVALCYNEVALCYDEMSVLLKD